MTTTNDWDNAPSPAGDPTLHAHKIGLHDVPEDDCPACRVDRGAALLDERLPGWWEDVDVNRLDLWSTCRCTLAQLHGGDYETGVDALGLSVWDVVTYGFDAVDFDSAGNVENFDRLTELWRSKINERRAR